MSLNPILDTNQQPIRVSNEHFILHGSGIEFELTIEKIGKLKGIGQYVLTTSRVVLLNN